MALDFMMALRSRAREQERAARLAGRPLTATEAAAPYVAAAETATQRLATGKELALREQQLGQQAGQFGEDLALRRQTLAENTRMEAERLAAQREQEAARLAEQTRATNMEADAAAKARRLATTQSIVSSGMGGINTAMSGYALGKKYGLFGSKPPTTPVESTPPASVVATPPTAAENPAIYTGANADYLMGTPTSIGSGTAPIATEAALESGYTGVGEAGTSLAAGAGNVLSGVATAVPYYAAAKMGGQLVEAVDSENTGFSTFGESLDRPLNVERTWTKSMDLPEPIDKALNTDVVGVFDFLNPTAPAERWISDATGTVLCTELNRQGKLEDHIYRADSAYGRMIDSQTLLGYHLWAVPLARLMKRSGAVTEILSPFIRAWAQEMAFRMGAEKCGSRLGRALEAVGKPICRGIGRMISLPVAGVGSALSSKKGKSSAGVAFKCPVTDSIGAVHFKTGLTEESLSPATEGQSSGIAHIGCSSIVCICGGGGKDHKGIGLCLGSYPGVHPISRRHLKSTRGRSPRADQFIDVMVEP